MGVGRCGVRCVGGLERIQLGGGGCTHPWIESRHQLISKRLLWWHPALDSSRMPGRTLHPSRRKCRGTANFVQLLDTNVPVRREFAEDGSYRAHLGIDLNDINMVRDRKLRVSALEVRTTSIWCVIESGE